MITLLLKGFLLSCSLVQRTLVAWEETREEYLNGKKEYDLIVGKYLFSLFLKKD